MSGRRFLRFLARRLLHAVPLLAGIVTLTFVLIRLAPGDPVYMMAGEGGDEAYYAEMRARYGLDRPLLEQYLVYARSVAAGDFGFSYGYQQPVFAVVRERLPPTLLLTGSALVAATLLGLLAGLLSALYAHSRLDGALRIVTSCLYSAPVFWTGQLLLLAFAIWLPVFPVGGMTSLRMESAATPSAGDVLWHLVLPCTALTFGFLALTARVTRAGLLVERRRDYVRAAQARGLSCRGAVVRHALPNAALPVVTLVGHQTGALLTGAALVEALFAWPGVGRLLLDASLQRDYPLVIAVLLTASFMVVAANVITDAAYGALDPRIEL
jgi:peptide/nickel transport system permease protein